MTTTTYTAIQQAAITEHQRLEALMPMQPAIKQRAKKVMDRMSADSETLLALVNNLCHTEELEFRLALFLLMNKCAAKMEENFTKGCDHFYNLPVDYCEQFLKRTA